MSTRQCEALECGRPARKRGFCQMHYKRFQRGDKPQVERLSQSPGPPVPEGPKTLIFDASEQGFVPNLSGLTQVQQSAVIGTGTKRYQLAGSTCSDCADKPASEWCYSDAHPTYASTP